MEIDLVFLAFAVPGILIAGISKAGFGGAASFVATPILAIVVDPGVALGLLLPLLMVMDGAGLRAYWRQWSLPHARALLVGAVPGMAMAAAIYRVTDPDVFRLLIGVIALAFAGFQGAVALGLVPRRRTPLPVGVGRAAGAAAGFTSFVAHAGGPAALIYLLSQGLSKTAFQATTVLVFTAINVAKAGLYAGLGVFTADLLLTALALVPVALAGAWLGVRAHRLIRERDFYLLTYALLAGSGVKLIWDALA